jgi:hypothetical protein
MSLMASRDKTETEKEMVRDGFAWRYVRYDKAANSPTLSARPGETPRTLGRSESGAAVGIPKGASTGAAESALKIVGRRLFLSRMAEW